jgi:hypothetical protein
VLTKTSVHGAALAVNRLARRRGTTRHGVRCSRSSTGCVPIRPTAPMLASPGREMTLVSKSTSWRRILERAASRRLTGCARSRSEPLATVSQPRPHGSVPASRSLVQPSGSSLREDAIASRPGGPLRAPAPTATTADAGRAGWRGKDVEASRALI